MFKMLEIIGSSPTSFSEAVKDAINQIIESGEQAHFFEVIEQRGAIREGKFKEFQVKLKVAVEVKKNVSTSKKKSKDSCPTCQQPVGDAGHMCVPVTRKDKTCDWCGALIPDERHLCDEKIKELSYICNSCGRTAVKAEYLCSPRKIK
jgi:flavin-binding protein dodecin